MVTFRLKISAPLSRAVSREMHLDKVRLLNLLNTKKGFNILPKHNQKYETGKGQKQRHHHPVREGDRTNACLRAPRDSAPAEIQSRGKSDNGDNGF